MAGGEGDFDQDGTPDLLLGAFVIPGVYVLLGDGGGAVDNSTAVKGAIATAVVGCLFLIAFEARSWVSIVY